MAEMADYKDNVSVRQCAPTPMSPPSHGGNRGSNPLGGTSIVSNELILLVNILGHSLYPTKVPTLGAS